MKTHTAGFSTASIHFPASLAEKRPHSLSLGRWIKNQEPLWEQNRLGIAATGILIQVTFAGAMIAVLGAAGAPPLVYTFGILMAFLADSLAFAQARMRWVLAIFLLSSILNFALTIIYGLQLI